MENNTQSEYMGIKQVIIIRKDLKMRRGKEAAQCAHASMKVILDNLIDAYPIEGRFPSHYISTFSTAMNLWLANSFRKIVVSCDSEKELLDLEKEASKKGIPHAIIKDNGETEFKKICHDCDGIGIVGIGSSAHNGSELECDYCKGTGKVNNPTYTCLAIGPDWADKIDEITKHLKLR